MSIEVPIDRADGRGFRVTSRGGTGDNLTTNKGEGRAETVLGGVEGAEQDTD